MFRTATALALAAALVAAGCGSSSSSSSQPNPKRADQSPPGDIPDNQAYVTYRPPGAGYAVKVPEGWARTVSGGAVTFTDKLNSIRLQALTAAKASKQPGAPAKVTKVRRTAGTATRATYLANSAPDPVTGRRRLDAVERYVFVHGGRAAVLTLSGPKGADNVDPWRIVTDSLRWTR
jgi:hypothetical protein